MKGRLLPVAALLVLISLMSGSVMGESKIILKYWTPPNPVDETFQKGAVERWNSTHPDVQIDWKPIPAGASSEEVILSALATNTGPDICANIFLGFAETLASSNVVVPLNKLPGFRQTIKNRAMDGIIKKFASRDGNNYLMPIYTNAMLMAYNAEMLKGLGLTEPPKTYGKFLALGDKVKAKGNYLIDLSYDPAWWARWFDFFTLYYAAGQGQPFIANGKAAFNNRYGLEVSKFAATVFSKKYAPLEKLTDPFQNGKLLATVFGPWSVPWTAQYYPNFKYVLGPILVPDSYPAGKPVYTFADAKGVVIMSSVKGEKLNAAWEFIKWLVSDENDLAWLKTTDMLPSRADLSTNPLFAEYFKANPISAEYAKAVPYAVPPPAHPKIIEIQTDFSTAYWEPLIYGKLSPEQALKAGVQAVQKYLKK